MPQTEEKQQCAFTCYDTSESSQERHINTWKMFRFSFQSVVGLEFAENQALQFSTHRRPSVVFPIPSPSFLPNPFLRLLRAAHAQERVIPSFFVSEDLVQGGAGIPTSSDLCSCVHGLS